MLSLSENCGKLCMYIYNLFFRQISRNIEKVIVDVLTMAIVSQREQPMHHLRDGVTLIDFNEYSGPGP